MNRLMLVIVLAMLGTGCFGSKNRKIKNLQETNQIVTNEWRYAEEQRAELAEEAAKLAEELAKSNKQVENLAAMLAKKSVENGSPTIVIPGEILPDLQACEVAAKAANTSKYSMTMSTSNGQKKCEIEIR